jgi:hypothetical protein
MRSPQERAFWRILAALLLAGGIAAWWTSDQWIDQAGPWLHRTWRTITRPDPSTLNKNDAGPQKNKATASTAADGNIEPLPSAQPRKCVQANRIIYTDQACPKDSVEATLDGGAVTSVAPRP